MLLRRQRHVSCRPSPGAEKLEAIFRHKVFKMLLAKGKITAEMIRMLLSWRHSGFNVFYGSRISPRDETAMENLARYIIRASFSQERMTYLDQEATVVYKAKDGKDTKVSRDGMAGRHVFPHPE